MVMRAAHRRGARGGSKGWYLRPGAERLPRLRGVPRRARDRLNQPERGRLGEDNAPRVGGRGDDGPSPMTPPPEPSLDALLPPEMAIKAEQLGVKKARMGRVRMLALSVLA